MSNIPTFLILDWDSLSGSQRQAKRILLAAFTKLELHGNQHPGGYIPHICCHPGDISLSCAAWQFGLPALRGGGASFRHDARVIATRVGLKIHERDRLVFDALIDQTDEVSVSKFKRGPWEYRAIAYGRAGEASND